MRMNCTVPVQDNDFVIEPNSKTTLLIPRSVCAKGQSPVVCFMNVTDNPVRLQGGIEVAEAHAVTVIESMDDPQELSVGTCSTSKKDQKSKLRTLLYTYSDVFAKTEFDLGNFSHVEHEIDTGDARPIQLRMRRTPACFVQGGGGTPQENVRCWSYTTFNIRMGFSTSAYQEERWRGYAGA
ncbi:Hypothetical predicted protein [Mytilus galloprovincialis]|uniref:Uncharacterized protein n=1 Tax=Mytilus galloprovincialis TaxID=29158 RepID=A0A8B6GEC6_MYTGA|nr:Hypothetical predicted protein [Mytilus galloprovincialis]